MPRPPRAHETGGLYHTLNRGNLRADIFKKDAAFEQILHEGLEIHDVELYAYQLMSNHYHLVLRPLVDGEMSRFMGWIGGTHTMGAKRGHSTFSAFWGARVVGARTPVRVGRPLAAAVSNRRRVCPAKDCDAML